MWTAALRHDGNRGISSPVQQVMRVGWLDRGHGLGPDGTDPKFSHAGMDDEQQGEGPHGQHRNLVVGGVADDEKREEME